MGQGETVSGPTRHAPTPSISPATPVLSTALSPLSSLTPPGVGHNLFTILIFKAFVVPKTAYHPYPVFRFDSKIAFSAQEDGQIVVAEAKVTLKELPGPRHQVL